MSVYFPDEEIRILRLHLNSCLNYTSGAIDDVIKNSPNGDVGLDDFEKYTDLLTALLHDKEDLHRLLSYLPKDDCLCKQH